MQQPIVLYHGTRAPESVLATGLEPRDGLSNEGMLGEGIEEAVFLTPDPLEAAEYGTVLRVDAVGLTLDIVDGPETYHYFSLETIAPERLLLVDELDAENAAYEVTL